MKAKIRTSTKPELNGSFVYFIFSKDVIYVGETQKISFSRWVQHFYKSGTFAKKIKSLENNYNYLEKVNLISIELLEIRELYPAIKWKTLTQAVEHSLHILLKKSPSLLLNSYYTNYEPEFESFKIISDTSKTAPRYLGSSDWHFANQYSNHVLNKVIEHIT